MVPSTFEGGIKEIKANQELSAENDPLMYKTGCGG